MFPFTTLTLALYAGKRATGRETSIITHSGSGFQHGHEFPRAHCPRSAGPSWSRAWWQQPWQVAGSRAVSTGGARGLNPLKRAQPLVRPALAVQKALRTLTKELGTRATPTLNREGVVSHGIPSRKRGKVGQDSLKYILKVDHLKSPAFAFGL